MDKTEREAEILAKEPQRKEGLLTKIIHGTAEGRAHDAHIEASFSQVIARGKYVHSIVFHRVKPDKVDEYTKLVGDWYPRMAALPENKVHLVGSFRTEVGECDTFGMSLQLLFPLAASKVEANSPPQFISGSTSAIPVTTDPSTPSPSTPTSPSSTASCAP